MALGVNINAPEGAKIEKRLLPMEIAGLVIAGILVVALMLLLLRCICKCARSKKEEDRHAYHKTNDIGQTNWSYPIDTETES